MDEQMVGLARREAHLAAHWEPGHVPRRLPDALYRSPLIEANVGCALFRLETVGRFLVRVGEPTIVERVRGATDEDVECLLRGPVAALRCSLAGQFTFRGAAVEVARRTLVFCGGMRGGSSLVAGLALRGHRVVADGVVLVGVTPAGASPVPEARPGRVTLWADSVRALGLDPADGEVVRPALASRSFALGPPPRPGPSPLAALVIPVIDYRLGVGDPLVVPEAVGGFPAVAALLEAQWHFQLPPALGLQKEQFQWATCLASDVPVVLLRRAEGEIELTLPALMQAAEDLLA